MSSRDDLLQRLEAAGGRPVSGAGLARELAISRAAVWKHVRGLRAAGYDIGGTPGSGYVLRGRPDRLLPAELGRGLPTAVVGRELRHFESVGSTNDEVRRLGLAGAPEGVVVVAEEQRAGRGRRGRSWESPLGGVYLSALLRPACHPAAAPRLTLCAALAVAEALADAGAAPRIKWPNDVLIDGRKVCGILLELVAREDLVDFVVIGIGLNVNNPPPGPDATSLGAAVGRRLDRVAVCRSVLRRLDAVYGDFRSGGWPALLDRWRAWCDTLGRLVRVAGVGGVCEGRAVDVDGDGALLLSTADGGSLRLLAGEVTVRDAGP
jgi:BirA family biotin operon repressor/biotin-[acetyl-CoA-carboxylase] ligase